NAGVQLEVVVIDGFDLAPGALQIACESEQLEKKETLAVVARVGFDLLDLSADGIVQLAGAEEFGCIHRSYRHRKARSAFRPSRFTRKREVFREMVVFGPGSHPGAAS